MAGRLPSSLLAALIAGAELTAPVLWVSWGILLAVCRYVYLTNQEFTADDAVADEPILLEQLAFPPILLLDVVSGARRASIRRAMAWHCEPRTTQSESVLLTRPSSEGPSAERPLRVFVFLGHGFGARQWTERWSKGEIPGLNERLPYGYHHAAGKDCIVEYSEDANENRLTELARRGMRRLLGCDLVHAWRNRKALFAPTSCGPTPSKSISRCWRSGNADARDRRPKLIAQSVWLFDRWHRFSAPRRWVYRHLLSSG